MPGMLRARLCPLAKLFNADAQQGLLTSNWYWAVCLALVIGAVNIGLVLTIDNTNLGTTNGLWKTPSIYAWEHGTGQPFDTGGYLYLRIAGSLCHLIPDHLMQFGAPSPVVTFRKLAVINGLLGGVASALIFLLALRFSGSRPASLIVVLAHAGAAFVLVNSINSEDILLPYTLFLGATTCIFEFLRSTKIWLLVLSAILFSITTLVHWTLMVPGLAAYGAILLVLVRYSRSYLLVTLGWLLVFLLTTRILATLFLPGPEVSLWAILYPAKARYGDAGFMPQKFIYFLIGIGNYFHGGFQVGNYHGVFTPGFVGTLVLSWVLFLVSLPSCIAALLYSGSPVPPRCLAAFALTVALVGQVGNLYSQPEDPQMHMQPMIVAFVGYILLARRFLDFSQRTKRILAGGCILAALANGGTNIRGFETLAGEDSRSIRAAAEVESLFPHDRYAIVNHGFEPWLSWQYILYFKGDWNTFRSASFDLVRPFYLQRGESAPNAVRFLRNEIDGALASGKRVVACSLWTQTPEQFTKGMTTLTVTEQAQQYDSALRRAYRVGAGWKVQVGPFVELLPSEAAPRPAGY